MACCDQLRIIIVAPALHSSRKVVIDGAGHSFVEPQCVRYQLGDVEVLGVRGLRQWWDPQEHAALATRVSERKPDPPQPLRAFAALAEEVFVKVLKSVPQRSRRGLPKIEVIDCLLNAWHVELGEYGQH